ncbi:Hypothetical predicted protein [Xyrichtys novacula]|uniref:Uncharacterized protein n=1 Tax=Xyrichtys novacula TaxID=13765 RepID=A0AAV1FDU9_XYRNO|nr:Hypothetical predicted protein [Xyrichtys novacula]
MDHLCEENLLCSGQDTRSPTAAEEDEDGSIQRNLAHIITRSTKVSVLIFGAFKVLKIQIQRRQSLPRLIHGILSKQGALSEDKKKKKKKKEEEEEEEEEGNERDSMENPSNMK